MAFGSMDRNGSQAPMAEINVVPLVDVMLVLLVKLVTIIWVKNMKKD